MQWTQNGLMWPCSQQRSVEMQMVCWSAGRFAKSDTMTSIHPRFHAEIVSTPLLKSPRSTLEKLEVGRVENLKCLNKRGWHRFAQTCRFWIAFSAVVRVHASHYDIVNRNYIPRIAAMFESVPENNKRLHSELLDCILENIFCLLNAYSCIFGSVMENIIYKTHILEVDKKI